MLTIICQQKDPQPWKEALQVAAPNLHIRIWPDDEPREDITFALSWKHPAGVFSKYPNLKGICSMGAGVDHLLSDTSIPEGIQLMRIVDEALAQSMWEHLVAVVFRHLRNLGQYQIDQQAKIWKPIPYSRIQDVRVGIMGLGQLGGDMAVRFAQMGFAVNGWANSAKVINGVNCFAGKEELPVFLQQSDILICLLPLTPETQHILCTAKLSHCPKGTYLINVARGGVLHESELIGLLDSGRLAGACLDVFQQEPLPAEHPFWSHPSIFITPHIASITEPESVVGQVLENFSRVMNGKAVLNGVDKWKGY